MMITPARMMSVALATLGVGLSCAASALAAPAPVVKTTSGRLLGVRTATAREFLGVRYAKPPVGKLRWAPPQPLTAPPRGLIKATRPGASCAQTATMGSGSDSEDCLFLNVTTPRHVAAGARLPVMVWVHGGGYTSGSGAQYDAQRLASQGRVVVITVNYRLGIFGYLGLPGLKGGGDFGMLDIVQALRWAKANAGAFGGDPHNITLFGESAGAMQTCALLTSPLARGLIEKAATESGSCEFNWPRNGLYDGTPAQTPYASATVNHAVSKAIARTFGCAGSRRLACLRRLPARRLLKASVDFSDVLAYGTPSLPRDPAVALRTGHVLRVPVLIGTNANEANPFVAGVAEKDPKAFTSATYPTLLSQAFGSRASAVAAQYPLSPGTAPGATWASLITSDSFACPSLLQARLLAPRQPVYAFEFNDPHSPDVNGVHAPGIPQGSGHATEMPYLFDLNGKNLLANPASRTLSRAMIAYWASFAHTGHPAAPGQPAWPRFTPGGSTVQGLDASGITATNLATEHDCGFWQTINPKDR